jgi:type VI secretion system protein ImpA
LDYLYAAPVCQRRGATPISFESLLTAQGSVAAGSAPVDSAEFAQVAAAIRAGGAEQAATHRQTLVESIESLKAIDSFLTTSLGVGGTISFEELQKTLETMSKALGPFLSDGMVPAVGADTPSGAATVSMTIRGQIRSREEVLRQLENICEYYRQVEPSSPVPFLLRRAQKLVNMNFVQVVQELNLATESLRPSIGVAVDGTTSSAGPPPASS